LLTKLEDFSEFFNRFNKEELLKLAICIDSAHVHACGYDSIDYLNFIKQNCSAKIKLFHFNDSSVKLGSRVDRHATPGCGYIGLSKMMDIAEWCTNNLIPMIIE